MAYVCTLLDDYGNKTYPITVIDAIYDNNGIKLQSILDDFALVSDLKNYAPKSHSHPEYQTTAGMTNYSTTSHKHEDYLTTSKALSDYAPKIHSHSQYQTTADMNNYLTTSMGDEKYAVKNHFHSQYLTTASAGGIYAPKEHVHSQYQTIADMSNYSTTSHTHLQYLTTANAKESYASKEHSHSQYLSTSGTAANSNKLGNVAASAYLTTASGKKFYEVSGTLAAGATSLSLSNGNITTASTIDVYSSVYGISPTKMTVSAGKVNMTFDAQTVAATIKVRAS